MSNRHLYFSDPAVGRLMGTVMALSGELFVAKSELEVLKRALVARGAITEDDLDRASETEDMHTFLVDERNQYAEHLFEPIRVPDLSMEQHWELFGEGHDPDAASDSTDGSTSTLVDN